MQSNINGGGNGVTANKGSSVTATTYLEHELLERIEYDPKTEQLQDIDFSVDGVERRGIGKDECHSLLFGSDQKGEYKEGWSINDAADMIDNNVKGLRKDDAKFYMIDFNPSKEEQEAIFKGCSTDRQREQALQDYVRNVYLNDYAANFHGYKDRQTGKEKQFTADDLVWNASVHQERKSHPNEKQGQWHVHIDISRQTRPVEGEKQYSLSPRQNNKETSKSKKAAVKTYFNRNEFYKRTEKSFDRRFGYERKQEETFEYKKQTKQERQDLIFTTRIGMKLPGSNLKADIRELEKYNEIKKKAIEEAKRREAVRRAEREKARAEREAAKQQQATQQQAAKPRPLNVVNINGQDYKMHVSGVGLTPNPNLFRVDLERNGSKETYFVKENIDKFLKMSEQDKARILESTMREQSIDRSRKQQRKNGKGRGY